MSITRTVFFSIILLMVGQFTLDVYLPSLPAMPAALHTSSYLVSLTISVYLFAFGAGQLLYGPLADQYGRRPILRIGLIIFMAGSLLCAFSQHIGELLLGRFIQGAGTAASTVIARSILRDRFTGNQLAKYMSLQLMIWFLVPMLAPIIGGYVQHYMGWQMNFMIILTISILLMIISFALFNETLNARLPQSLNLKSVFTNYLYVLSKRNFVGYTLIVAFFYSAVICVIQLSPYLLQNILGISANHYGWFLLVAAIGPVFSSGTNFYISERFNIRHILILGFSLVNCIGLIILLVCLSSYISALLIMILISILRFSFGIVVAHCYSGALSSITHHTGSAAALYGASLVILSAVVSALAAHLSTTFVTLGSVLFLLPLAATASYWLIVKPKPA